MLIDGYPNLELLEFKAKLALKEKNSEKYANASFRADVFLQAWASTALGFGGIGGQAMSEAYTTVFSDDIKNAYVVFFGNRIAYIVENPKPIFFEDLKVRDMKAIKDALIQY